LAIRRGAASIDAMNGLTSEPVHAGRDRPLLHPDQPARSGADFSRLSDADALSLYHDLSIHELGKRAFERLMQLHPEPYRTYVVDRNINYSNICTAKCIFCNFKTDPGKPDGYILSFEQIGRKIEELLDIGGTQILMQGGLVPASGGHEETGDKPVPAAHALPFEWYLDLLRFIRRNYPTIHIHAFSPPEIWAFHQVYHMPLRDVLLRLQEAGLATIPGGGGEILVDRVRRKIGQGKTLTAEWLEVMRQAHRIGMKTSCTMMMGHIETIEERIEHMPVLRELQDETGGFTAFIHWPFQPEGAPLGRWPMMPIADETGSERLTAGTQPAEEHSHDSRGGMGEASSLRYSDLPRHASGVRRLRPDGVHLLLADAHEYLVTLAMARLYLDNIPNMQSSWVTMGPKIGQLALFYGANDMGSVMMEENVVSQAGATFRLSEDEIRRLITDAGWQPQQRDQYYRPIDTPARRRARIDAPRVSAVTADAPAAVVPLTVAGGDRTGQAVSREDRRVF
jgi:cyclic dehypoxanthinyl futalosine synthase